MTPGQKDQVEGTLHEVKGKLKEKAGQVTNDPGLEAKGQVCWFSVKWKVGALCWRV